MYVTGGHSAVRGECVCTSLVDTVQYVVRVCMVNLVLRLSPQLCDCIIDLKTEEEPGNEAVHLPASPTLCLSLCLSLVSFSVSLSISLSSLQAPEVLKDKKYHSSVR